MASATATHGGHLAGLAKTNRTDKWWVGPLATALGLGAFVIYSTFAGAIGNYYWFDGTVDNDGMQHQGYGGYLSPMYSPILISNAGKGPHYKGVAPVSHSWFNTNEWPSFWPEWIAPFTPAVLILIFPLSFRATCYYYRKAYYRAFFATPPGCAVGPLPQKKFNGETKLLIFQNLHRYAMYAALAFLVILAYDAYQGFWRDGRFGVGVGSLVLTVNVCLLSSYTFGCHSFRHLIGGRKNCFSCVGGPLALASWKKASWFNKRHQLFAWCSLIWVGFTDLYVRLCSMGVIHDFSTWG
ncbi:MAG: succinate dehydrogenase [Planctomycetota bacterium]